jgi:hypothetical protein
MTTLIVNKLQTVDSYPYGRLRAEARFSIEFNPKKGFRSVFQTINPKNGRVNKPKLGTYSDIMYMEIVDGHVSFNSFYLSGREKLNKAFKFLFVNFDLYTKEQIESISISLLASTKIDMQGTVVYGGAKLEDIKEFYKNPIETLVKIVKTGENLFNSIEFNCEAIDATKPADFNPFGITTY